MKHYFDKLIKQIASAIASAVVEELQTSVTQIARVDLQPGDSLLFRVKGNPNLALVAEFRHRLEQQFPGHRIVILSGATDMQVLGNVGREKSSARG